MPRWVIGDLLTGTIRADVSPSTGTWADTANAAAAISCVIPVQQYINQETREKTLNLRALTTPWWAFLAAIDEETGIVLQAGPITGRPWAEDTAELTLTATSLWGYWQKRILAPFFASPQRLTDVSMVVLASDGLSLGTIAAHIVRDSLAWPNGNLPIDIPADSPGNSIRTYLGSDGALISDRLSAINQVQNGPDIFFRPYLSDPKHIRWQMVVGTDSMPWIHGNAVQIFDYTAPENGMSGISIDETSTNMASTAFAIGGDSTSTVLAGQSMDSTLIKAGYPQLQMATSYQSVSILGTLDQYAAESTANGHVPQETWTMAFQRKSRPYLQDYQVGDWCKLRIDGDPWIDDDVYDKRVVSISGDQTDEKVQVTFMGDGDILSYMDRLADS